MANGIDVSNNNRPEAEFRALAGLDFAIAKATEGTTFADGTFGSYAQQAKDMALGHFGAYHFGHPEHLQGRAEAQWFMTHATPRPGWSLWYDYETFGASGQADAEVIGLFTMTIREAFPRARCGIYTNGTGLARIRPYLAEIPFNGLWFADPSHPMGRPDCPTGWQIHQYETLNGIDRDYWAWDITRIRDYYQW